MSNETCSPVDFIRFNPTKTLVDAYLCIDGMPAKPGLEYYKRTDIKRHLCISILRNIMPIISKTGIRE